MTSYKILSSIEYWLVEHPTIKNFRWTTGTTIASTPQFLFFTVFSYLSTIFILTNMKSSPSIPSSFLKPISAVHSTALLVLSFVMALGCLLSTISYAPHLHLIICIPPNTKPNGPIFFWAYIFYLSKILEFMDTILIIMSNSIKRLSFLHVYHHSNVVIMCYIWLQTSQTLFPAVLITNASVHVLMYAYYLSCALGYRPKWKKVVTDIQIVQFRGSFVALGLMLYYHFTSSSGCSGVWGWTFNFAFNASLLLLFLDFHHNNYAPSPSSSFSSNNN